MARFTRTLTVRRRRTRVRPTTFTLPRKRITARRNGLVTYIRPRQIVRRRGFTSSAARFQIRDIGAPGRGEKVIPPLKAGRMTRLAVDMGFIRAGQRVSDMPTGRIRRFAVALARKVGAQDALGMFQAQVVFRRRTGGPAFKKFVAGRNAIARRFGKELRPTEAIQARLAMGESPGPG